jgi:hypothetical protein
MPLFVIVSKQISLKNKGLKLKGKNETNDLKDHPFI